MTGVNVQKYDRQLRLWGEHGQKALQEARVCLINGTATGTEIMKNLILPGIGSFTVVDGNVVSGADAGRNFFLDESCISKPRAECTATLLQELNMDVEGDFVAEHPEALLDGRPEFFHAFTLVIATDLNQCTLLRLATLLYEANIPFMVARSYGMIGYLRLATPKHTVVESHPDNPFLDLRLDTPFPELLEFLDRVDLPTMADDKHRLVPWLVILQKAVLQWKAQHNGTMPQARQDREDFKKLLNSGRRSATVNNPHYTEENYDEAERNLTKAYMPTRVPETVSQIFAMPEVTTLTHRSAPFWIMSRALKDFVTLDSHGLLPVKGSLPDMFSDTSSFIDLQRVFRNKAEADAQAVIDRVQRLLQGLNLPSDTIKDADVRLFCKNAYNLRVVDTGTMAEEYSNGPAIHQALRDAYESGLQTVNWYVLLRAARRFCNTWQRYPGAGIEDIAGEEDLLRKEAQQYLADLGLPHTVPDDYVKEMCRYGASELHSVAAVIGGIGAQEAVKVLTHQFVPFNNTLIYNGIDNTTLALRA